MPKDWEIGLMFWGEKNRGSFARGEILGLRCGQLGIAGHVDRK
jgi:hypothetical protein